MKRFVGSVVSLLRSVAIFALIAMSCVLIGLPLNPWQHFALSVSLLMVGYVVVSGHGDTVPGRVVFSATILLIAFRYLSWRFSSLPLDHSLASSVGAVVLLVAECYGVAMLALGCFVNSDPITRESVPLPADQKDWPIVDVFIPTYSEGMDIVTPTFIGALNMDYPANKLRVHILDDGFPRASGMGKAGESLLQRAQDLRNLCAKFGGNYITRDNNRHAKAGNMNNALKHTSGDLVLVLDADHIPTKDFLLNTVGFFVQNKNVAFVQTPHFFINADPLEKNLSLFQKMPAENDLFYAVVQKGLDRWNASFFCGSAAVLRRSSLESAGGFATDSITEDASTAIALHRNGHESVYLAKPMVAGLQPESFDAFILQRSRWAIGMMQIFIRKNPLFCGGLSVPQRLAYLSSMMYWFFPLARTIYFILPVFATLFGLTVYPEGLDSILFYSVPYLAASLMSFNVFFGRYRKFFISEVYETLQAFFMLPGLIGVLLRPSKPVFKVTPKGECSDQDHVSPMAWPFYLVYAASMVGFYFCVYRLFAEEANRGFLLMSLFWLALNTVLLNVSLGVLVEKAQKRSRPRIETNKTVEVEMPGGQVSFATMIDANEKGALLNIEANCFVPFGYVRLGKHRIRFEALAHRWMENAPGIHPVLFDQQKMEDQVAVIEHLYGDSAHWSTAWENRQNGASILANLGEMVALGFLSFKQHAKRKLAEIRQAKVAKIEPLHAEPVPEQKVQVDERQPTAIPQ